MKTSNSPQANIFMLVAHPKSLVLDHIDEVILDAADHIQITFAESGDEALTRLEHAVVHIALLSSRLENPDCWSIASLIQQGALRCDKHTPTIIFCDSEEEKVHTQQYVDEIGNDNIVLFSYDNLTLLPPFCLQCLERRQPNVKSVLIIEDDVRIANWARDALARSFEVELAYTGETGLAAWRERKHQLVILDIRLSDDPASSNTLSGLDVQKAIVATHPLQPIGIFTANDTQDNRIKFMSNKAIFFIAKEGLSAKNFREVCEHALVVGSARSHHYNTQLVEEKAKKHEQAIDTKIRLALIASNRGHHFDAAKILTELQALRREQNDPNDDHDDQLSQDNSTQL